MNKYSSYFLLCLVFGLAACGGKSESNSKSPTPALDPPQMSKRTRSTNLKLADAEIREVIPTSDGGAYILSDDDQLWYVRGNKAVKVYEADSAKLSSQIFPNSTGSFFAQWVRERQHRKSLEAENQELEGRIDMLEGEMGELKNENGSGNEN